MDIDRMERIVVRYTGPRHPAEDFRNWIDYTYGVFTGLIEQTVLTGRDRRVLEYRPNLRRELANAGDRGGWAGFSDYLSATVHGIHERAKISERLDSVRDTHGRRLAEDVADLLLSHGREHYRALSGASADPIVVGGEIAAIRDGAPDSPKLGPALSSAARNQGRTGVPPEPFD